MLFLRCTQLIHKRTESAQSIAAATAFSNFVIVDFAGAGVNVDGSVQDEKSGFCGDNDDQWIELLVTLRHGGTFYGSSSNLCKGETVSPDPLDSDLAKLRSAAASDVTWLDINKIYRTWGDASLKENCDQALTYKVQTALGLTV